jgi:outer membrane protein assembly factor BamB
MWAEMSGVSRRAKSLLCCVAACLAFALAGSANADPGALAVAYQINVAHSGVQTDAALTPPFGLRWQVTLPAQVSYPLIAEGKVFVTAASSRDNATRTPVLYALDQASGRTLWSQTLPLGWQRANAAYDNGRIFVSGTDPVCCQDGVALAYAADTGALLWRTELPWQYATTAAPTAANGVVYISGSGSGDTLFSLSEDDGHVLATQAWAGGDQSSPALSDTGVFVSYACNQAYGFGQTTLASLWHYSTFCSGGGGKTTVYADGRVYTRDYFGSLVLDATTGALLRTYEPQGVQIFAPAVDSSSLFATSTAGSLSAESLDGTPLWSFAGEGYLNTAPLIINNGGDRFVLVGSGLGRLYALDAASGQQIWSTDVGTPITGVDEQNASEPLAGLAAGQGLIAVPAGKTLSAYANDHTAPVLSLPATVNARGVSQSGGIATYSVSATDPDDTATASCTPPSGAVFPVGVTTVNCTATDTAGNTTTGEFLVVVSAPNADCNLSHYPVSKGSRNLKNANLSGCYLPNANLAAANATGANLSGAYFADADLSSANLSQANLRGSVLTNANLSGVKWSQTTCPDGTLSTENGGTCVGHLT